METLATLCRICAADTRSKNFTPECVSILQTPNLKEKIEKHLYLSVSEDDALPKVICKSCYRSVEGIVSLSKIAVHTQMVLSNFLKPRAALIEPDAEFTTIVSPVKDYERALGGAATHSTAPKQVKSIALPPTSSAAATQLHKEKPKRTEDVVVNVSVSDPLTRETQQKMLLGAARQRQTLLDSRFIPKSIAHRHVSFATPKEATPAGATEPSNLNHSKSSSSPAATAAAATNSATSAASVINFYNSQQPQQQVTVTSGGYVIGQMNAPESTNSSSTNYRTTLPIQETEQRRKILKVPNKSSSRGTSAGQVSLLKVSQKPSSLLVNPSLSQSSLSDSSISSAPMAAVQPGPFERPRALSPPARKIRRPQRRPTIAEIPSSVEALPREIIIASVKKPKNKQPPAQSMQAQSAANQPAAAASPPTQIPVKPTTPSPPVQQAPQVLQAPQPQASQLQQKPQSKPRETPRRSTEIPVAHQHQHQHQHPHPQPQLQQQQQTSPKSLFPDDIPLGRVIRDFDLLKLIMKALKWPVIKENMEAQMDRLRNSKFTTVMSDPNLLQDTDLTQLLGPYLAPVMFAAQKLQQQQNATAAAMVSPAKSAPMPKANSPAEMPTDLSAAATALPYRLPPETSVQLVPASPEEEQAAKTREHKSRKSTTPHKRSRRNQSPRLREVSIVISDGEEDEPRSSNNNSQSRSRDKRGEKSSKHSKKTAESTESYDALKQLAERSRAALERVAPSRPRGGAETVSRPKSPPPPMHYPSFVDDIVLIEPEPPQRPTRPPKPQDSLPSVISMTSPDNLFSARALPPITRPIIKRRKTVIHSSAVNKPAVANAKSSTAVDDKQDVVSAAVQVPSMATNDVQQANAAAGPDQNRISVATSMSFFTGVTSHITGATVGTATSAASSVAPTTTVSAAAASASPREPKEAGKKSTSTKAALAEQLLEAVGLKKSNGATVEKTPSRESVQQIRSALKRSLKQAVEQNQRKQEELPVKQVADSTTRNKLIKSMEMVDVEDEIEKVTLQKNDRQISLLKTKSQASITARSATRSPRKGMSQASVIKNSATAVKPDKEEPREEKSELTDDPEDDLPLQATKSTFSQTSPLTSEADLLTAYVISGNNVTSTSEGKITESDNKTISETQSSTAQTARKKGRKRKANEETGGDGEDVNEDVKKGESKTNFDTKSVAGGDAVNAKDSNSSFDVEPKSEGANTSARPSRASKTSSKYYKGPEKPLSTRSTRSTRNK